MVSLALPGALGMIMRIGRSGYFCAASAAFATGVLQSAANTTAEVTRVTVFMFSS
jgi:hypothetical protein